MNAPSRADRMKHVDRARDLLVKHLARKTPIILYGDSDMDGVSCVVIAQETIQNLGGKVTSVYFPDRSKEGHGLTMNALSYLKDSAPALLIVMDCGVSNAKEIDLAYEMGFEVIVMDHHEPPDILPSKGILIDPKLKDDPYPFKGLCAAGVVLRFAQYVLGENASPALMQGLCEIAALASIADMVPREGENTDIIYEGLATLERTWRPGLQVLFDLPEVKRKDTMEEKAYEMVSILGSMEVCDRTNQSYVLLTTSSLDEAKNLAQELVERKMQKQEAIWQIVQEVQDRVGEASNDAFIFEGDERWELPFLGGAASRLCSRYGKPVFLYHVRDKESRGSVRSPHGISAVEAMDYCTSLLKAHGGHHPAAGFTVPNENIEKFREKLQEYFHTHI